MASGGQSNRQKSYDLKFNLDAVALMTWRVLIEAGGFYPRFYGTLNTDGPMETPADSPASEWSDVADVLTNQ